MFGIRRDRGEGDPILTTKLTSKSLEHQYLRKEITAVLSLSTSRALKLKTLTHARVSISYFVRCDLRTRHIARFADERSEETKERLIEKSLSRIARPRKTHYKKHGLTRTHSE